MIFVSSTINIDLCWNRQSRFPPLLRARLYTCHHSMRPEYPRFIGPVIGINLEGAQTTPSVVTFTKHAFAFKQLICCQFKDKEVTDDMRT
ncbi:hypothetical protein BJY52DRAFT_424159 [Lactarius psammicola]|nr:hypothetical protein BJY52DRAFT_424159 [Lactarius psammicola]